MSTQTAGKVDRTFEVLLVEDNPGDVTLMKEALKELDMRVNLRTVEDGVKAMEYLYKKAPYDGAATPDLVLLDINLPKRNGLSVLREIKNDSALKTIPVVVLTSSCSERDILKTYGLGGTLFITKPLGFHEFMECVKSAVSNLLVHEKLSTPTA